MQHWPPPNINWDDDSRDVEAPFDVKLKRWQRASDEAINDSKKRIERLQKLNRRKKRG